MDTIFGEYLQFLGECFKLKHSCVTAVAIINSPTLWHSDSKLFEMNVHSDIVSLLCVKLIFHSDMTLP